MVWVLCGVSAAGLFGLFDFWLWLLVWLRLLVVVFLFGCGCFGGVAGLVCLFMLVLLWRFRLCCIVLLISRWVCVIWFIVIVLYVLGCGLVR